MTEQVFDCIIIGAGPAGLQAGRFLKDKGIGFRILERGPGVGMFFRDFPRHRKMISINKVHTGLSNPQTRLRYDWNSLLSQGGPLFTQASKKYFPDADDFVAYLEDFARDLADDIETGAEVTEVARDAGLFRVTTADGQERRARSVIAATGFTQPHHPDFEGHELIENYFDFDTTPEGFTDKRVLVIGKGNSAFETADALIEHAQAIHVISPEPVKLAWQSHFVGHLRAVNNNFLDTYQLKSQNAVIDADITRIERADGVLRVHARMTAAEGHEIVLDYDRVIACTGFRFDPTVFAKDIRPGLCPKGRLPQMGVTWEAEGAPGLYFAGTITQFRDYKKTMSGFVHGFRHNVACLANLVEGRLNGTPYPHGHMPVDPATLNATIIDRVSTGAAMFLQPGFLCDAIVLAGAERGAHYTDVPVDWARSQAPFATGDWLMVTLEFGDFGPDAMHVKRSHMIGGAPDPFIHPVIRHMRGGEVVGEAHLADHLDADWRPAAAKDKGAGTGQRMTFRDVGRVMSPGEAAAMQLGAFLEDQGIGAVRLAEPAQ